MPAAAAAASAAPAPVAESPQRPAPEAGLSYQLQQGFKHGPIRALWCVGVCVCV